MWAPATAYRKLRFADARERRNEGQLPAQNDGRSQIGLNPTFMRSAAHGWFEPILCFEKAAEGAISGEWKK
jgi:hypothetical protein